MAFFSEKKLARVKIEIDDGEMKSDSPEVLHRLERIESNYVRLNEILSSLELKFSADSQYIKWLDESEIAEPNEQSAGSKGKRKKRKKRKPAAAKSKAVKSTAAKSTAAKSTWRPRKPR